MYVRQVGREIYCQLKSRAVPADTVDLVIKPSEEFGKVECYVDDTNVLEIEASEVLYMYQQKENDRLCISKSFKQVPEEVPYITIEMDGSNTLIIKEDGEVVYEGEVVDRDHPDDDGDEGDKDTGPGPEEGGDGDDDEPDDNGDVDDAESLEKALEEGGEITVEADIAGSFEVTKDTIIDLGDYTITAKGTAFTVEEGATLTIEGGSIVTTSTATNTSVDNEAAVYVESGSVTIEDTTITSDSIGVKAEDGASVTIGEGTEIDSQYFALWLGGDETQVTIEDGAVIKGTDKCIVLCGDGNYGHNDYQTGAVQTLNITGGEFSCENDSVICTLGTTNAYSAIINITGGTFTGADNSEGKPFPTIYIANGTLNISGDVAVTGSTPVEVRGGTTTIEGGTFTCTAKGDSTAENNSSGATSYGYALSVFPYGSGVKVDTEEADNDVSVYVTGGTFEGKLYGAIEDDYEGSRYGFTEYTFEITGGTFTDDPSAYVPEGYEVTEEADGTFTVA